MFYKGFYVEVLRCVESEKLFWKCEVWDPSLFNYENAENYHIAVPWHCLFPHRSNQLISTKRVTSKLNSVFEEDLDFEVFVTVA